MADVEKRLNSSLADLITQSKGSGTRGGRGSSRGRGGSDRGRGGRKQGTTPRESQGKASDKRQGVLAQKRGLQQPARGSAQKKGSAKGKTLAVPISKALRGGRGQAGGAGRRGRGGRGSVGGRGQLTEQNWNPASLKITIKNDRYMQSAPARPTYMDAQPDVYASNGLGGVSSSYFPQQRVSPLTFAGGLGLPMSIGGARARAPYASGGLYNAATAATAQQQRTSSGVANPMAWAGQAARSTGMPGSGLRMDAEYR
ncbi:g328 [Coccomyxa viridis]|uniref:G328 protein n=1 Tax=Coccomyxa viridis TaxID=1274662 RepID=A0ABP1FM62_9CHLO